jgi:phage terminase large subunit
VKELLYENNLTNEELINRLKELIIDKNMPIYADSEEPARIEEIYKCGFNIYPAEKSVKDGIEFLKRFKIYCQKNDVNFLKEIKNYKWQVDKNGNIIEGKPVKFNDHLIDALRYAVYTHLKDKYNIRDIIKHDDEIYTEQNLEILNL